jgi:D-glycero-D-manno-heptose 1,7-bisphosphate phosphatase
MLRQAAADLNLDLGHSVMVGDKLSDLEAGRAAGCRTILVRSGYGAESEQEINRSSRLDLVDGVFDSLIEAHRAILSWLEHP